MLPESAYEGSFSTGRHSTDMNRAKIWFAVAAVLCAVLVLSACAPNIGIITPIALQETSDFERVQFETAGISIASADAAEVSSFSYRWQEPVYSVKAWAELYRDGQSIAEPVEVSLSDLTAEAGTIALYTQEINDTTQEFALLVSNGEGSGSHAQVRTGALEIGEAMAPSSKVELQKTQSTELGETNVLLVMHDGPNLDTAMENSLDDTAQLIASSTYTLVLNCMFS